MSQSLRAKSPLFVVAAILLVIGVVWGVSSVQASRTPLTLDQHVQVIASQLQCPICHGESVADSPSAVATEIRALIRKDIQDGMTDQQILTYFRDRYSDDILEVPPVQGFDAWMWLGPLLVLLASAATTFWAVRRLRAQSHPEPAIALTSPAPASSASSAEDDPLRDLLWRELAEDEGYAQQPSARKAVR
jgi:cytochrome c-type biogenesis protein CcmH